MKGKKVIAKRLMVLYVTFIAVIVLAVVGRLMPDIKAGVSAGNMIKDIIESPANSGYNNTYLLTPILFEPFESVIPLSLSDSLVNIKAYSEQASLIVSEYSEELMPMFNIIGDHPIYYIASLVISFAFLCMLILIAQIILSLRRSMINEQSVDRSNTWRVRAIGVILIGSEIINALISWRVSLRADELLSGSGLNVITSFSPDYWSVMLGILILFMGELFAITHLLSEEQKFTI